MASNKKHGRVDGKSDGNADVMSLQKIRRGSQNGGAVTRAMADFARKHRDLFEKETGLHLSR